MHLISETSLEASLDRTQKSETRNKKMDRLPREVVDATFLERNQGQAGQGSEQPDLVEGIPAHCRGDGLDNL